jgi:putative iron-regulated protein
MSRPLLLTLCLCGALALAGCAEDKPESPATPAESSRPRAAAAPKPANGAQSPAWPIGQTFIELGLLHAQELKVAVDELLLSATIDRLESAQQAWRKTAGQLERFQVFARLGAVAPQEFSALSDLQFNLSAWPIQPGYLDSYGEHPYSGIVFDVGMPLSEASLREQHGMTDKADATLGIYAVEFLLFGEENSRGPLVFQPVSALSDKHRADGYQDVTELPRNRRRELLRLQVDILSKDLEQLQKLWNGLLRLQFESLASAQQLELLRKAALALVTEQLVAVANQQKPANALTGSHDLWQQQQLAERLAAQLAGLQRLNQTLNLGDELEGPIQAGGAALAEILKLPPITNQGIPPRVDWQDTYNALRELARALSGETAPAQENP